MATVKVAVRVRPFNDRENDLDSELIISMDDKKTRIVNRSIPFGSSQDGVSGREKVKEFSFDYSYWSFDKSDDTYASQEKLFADLGVNVVDSAYEGYNACVFAYGQTGSGKTYTMMGTPEDPGLIPRICESLFKRMHTGREEGTTYRVEVSYLEIYNEHVKDLLRKGTNTHNLRVREHPKHGPFVQDLSKHLVMDYADINELMNRGNAIRTTAATKMNDVSSRSHAIFTITFVQAKFHQDLPSETVSKVHLVDLAGSERADASGATGIRLKEGAHINKSLVTLGSVISSLADLSTSTPSEKIRIFIPYRDSVLTWLLKDSLGGNSKTVMLAAISPADVNYGETLSTLRYANRAKNIVNKPTVNEDPNVKLIRELKAEISKLRAMLEGSQNMSNPSQMVERLQENEAKVKVLTEEWTERWLETQKILQEQRALALRKDGLGVVLDSDKPHLVGIDDDVLSTGITLYHLKDGKTRIGNESSASKQDIILSGPGLQPEHCIIELREGVATLIPVNDSDCYVNTIRIDRPTKLSQGCIILLGRNNRFRYNNPAMAAELRKTDKGVKLNRGRHAFLSCSMPDLAGSVDNNGNISRTNLDTQFEADSLTNFSHDSIIPADAASKSSDVVSESVESQQPYINELMETRGNNVQSYESESCNLHDLLQESEKESYFGPLVDLKYLELNDRIVELVEQEVQRRIVEETSERLQQIRERQRELDIIRGSAFGPRLSPTNFHSVSLGCLRVIEPQVPQSFSITIPSYIQRGVGYSTHYEFEVRITTTEQAWTVYRRYKRFREFHMEVKQKYGDKIEDIPFPPRSFFRAHSESKIRERQRLLERYLQMLIDKCLQIPESPLSSLDYDSLTCDTLCKNFPFFRRGLFEIGKYGTS